MKNLFKKISALVLAAIMVLTMCSAVFADTNTPAGTAADKGSITVKGVEEGATVKAYPIVKAVYGADGTFTGYENTYNLGDITDPKLAELSNIASDKDLEAADVVTLDKQQDGSYKKDNLSVGMYLIHVIGTESTVYNVAVASINYVNANGDFAINPGEVVMVKDGAAWVKKSNAPTVTKKILESKTVATNKLGSTQNIGSDVKYEVTINPIPNYSGNHPTLYVEDTLSAGLTYNNGLEVKVKDGDTSTALTEDTDYVVTVPTENSNVLKVDFVVDGKYKLNGYLGKSVVITYKARLNTSATLDLNANTNTVKLHYTKDSKQEGNPATSEDKITNTYTFDLNDVLLGENGVITKVDSTQKTPLKDAEFTLYTNENCTEKYTNSVFKGVVKSDDNGKLGTISNESMKGFAAGTYYLKETKAPAGYSLNAKVYKVVISADNDKYNNNGELTEWTVTIDDTLVATNGNTTDAGIQIPNTHLSNLPSTGGMGTYLFTIVGVVLMTCAAGAFFVSRRKTNK